MRGWSTTGLVLAITVLSAASAVAQPASIRVRKGDRIDFAVRAEVEVTEILGDTERTVSAAASGVAQLTVERVNRRSIVWTYTTPQLESSDTGGVLARLRFSTDRAGRLVTKAVGTPALEPLMQAVHRSIVIHWFQPAVFRKLHPGDTWTEKRDDSIVVDELGIDARARYEVRYTFDGIVDTLGTRAIRLRFSAPAMTITGARTVSGYSLPLRGDGEHEGTAYFSTIDGLLLAGVSESSVDLRPEPTGEGAVTPTMWRLRAASVRR